MRVVLISAAVAALFAVGQAHAYDTFIPLGLGYSTQAGSIYGLSSKKQLYINQADIYETEIYQRQIQAREFDTRLRRFRNDRNSDGTDSSVDY